VVVSHRRSILLVLDGVGVGALPDAGVYGDEAANTLGNVASAVGGLFLPNLGALGLGNVLSLAGVPPVLRPKASWGRCAELSAGKDTITGHWELMGLVCETPFPLYHSGFPLDLLEAFTRETGYGWLGNLPASGTQIIQELGDEHVRSGHPIIYTSADSVFQIAAHEDVIGLSELHRICHVARERVCTGAHSIARVIARPFTGKDSSGLYVRTSGRKDFALAPSAITALDLLCDAGVMVTGVGKIADIFDHTGVTESFSAVDNMDAFSTVVELTRSGRDGLIFVNLIDFDTRFGHRRDARGFALALEALDRRLPELVSAMTEGDLLIITADHGCDPTTESTDHTREYVPLLVHMKGVDDGIDLHVRSSFADVGRAILDYHHVEASQIAGESFLAAATLSMTRE